MDKKFWDSIGWILVISNALGVIILFEMIFFKFPYITLFVAVLYCTWSFNRRLFRKKAKKTSPVDSAEKAEAA